MTIIFGFALFVTCLAAFVAVQALRKHIARQATIIERQEADLLTCVEAQRLTSQAMQVYAETFDEVGASLGPDEAALVAALTNRLANQSAILAQLLSHWDGASDPRPVVYSSDADAVVEELVLEANDPVLHRLWATRRPHDVALMVRHLVSLGQGRESAVELKLEGDTRLNHHLSPDEVLEAWRRPGK